MPDRRRFFASFGSAAAALVAAAAIPWRAASAAGHARSGTGPEPGADAGAHRELRRYRHRAAAAQGVPRPDLEQWQEVTERRQEPDELHGRLHSEALR